VPSPPMHEFVAASVPLLAAAGCGGAGSPIMRYITPSRTRRLRLLAQHDAAMAAEEVAASAARRTRGEALVAADVDAQSPSHEFVRLSEEGGLMR